MPRSFEPPANRGDNFKFNQTKSRNIFLGETTKIHLTVQGRYWAQFAYQFSHELCHYIVDKRFSCVDDRFGWLEESLCELASLSTLSRMVRAWETGLSPYPSWASYSSSLDQYLSDTQNQSNIGDVEHFSQWINQNLQQLQLDRYQRSHNLIVAKFLFNQFECNPQLWQSLQFLPQVNVSKHVTIAAFLSEWASSLPDPLSITFKSAFKDFWEEN